MIFHRFSIINSFLHIYEKFSDELTRQKILIVEEFINKINYNFIKNRKISNYLTVDECMASFQGRIYFKQYMKIKKRKWGIKFFSICDSFSSYTYKLIPYTGRDFIYNKEKGIGPSVISEFSKINFPENTHLSFDSFSTSRKEIEILDNNNVYFTATFLPNRKGFENFRNIKMNVGEVKVITDQRIKMIAFEDKRTVFKVSNKFSEKMMTYNSKKNTIKTVPEAIYVYNQTKSGVDSVDQICSVYSSKRKTYKWWKSVFFIY